MTETDLDANRCSVLVQRGKGGHRREVGMDMWAFNALRPWLTERAKLPVGALSAIRTIGASAWCTTDCGCGRCRLPNAAARRWRSRGMRVLWH